MFCWTDCILNNSFSADLNYCVETIFISAQCIAGQVIGCEECTSNADCLDTCGDNLQCLDCTLDFYQPDGEPVSTTHCQPCPLNEGTADVGATSEDQCESMCLKVQ